MLGVNYGQDTDPLAILEERAREEEHEDQQPCRDRQNEPDPCDREDHREILETYELP